MSLADRKEAAKAEEAKKGKKPNGTYSVRLADWDFTKSQKQDDKYELTWKIKKVLELKEDLPEGMEESDLKGKKAKTHHVLKHNFMLIPLLDILEGAGADLSEYDDNDMSCIDDILESIEDARMPNAIMEYEHNEGDQYPTITISEVENVLGGDSEEEEDDDEDEDEAPKAKSKPKSKPKSKKGVKAPS